MPDVDIISLPVGGEKLVLAKSLTEAFTRALGCPASDVTLRFHEISPKNYARDGRMAEKLASVTSGADGNPAHQVVDVKVAWYAGKPGDMQEKTAGLLVEAFQKVFPYLPAETVQVAFSELHYDTTFVGGKRVDAPKGARTGIQLL